MTEIKDLIISEYAKQYSTNWYKFDEGSGTILKDSKGSANGTITGGVWNEDGSLTLNGSNAYVTFPNNISIGGKKSIYLRFKVNSYMPTNTNPILDCSGNGDVTKNGFRFATVSTGILVYQASSNKGSHIASAITNNNFVSTEIIIDMLVTDSGLIDSNSTKIYVDNLYNPVVTGARTILDNYTTPSHSLTLGRQSDTVTNPWYSNITVYEMAIFKEDLSDLLINKSLVLSNGEYKKYILKQEATSDTYTDDLIPKMTSNTAPSGRAFASNSATGTGYAPWRAFDKTSNMYHENSVGFAPYNLGYIFANNEKKKVKAFSLTSVQAINMYKDFILQGSNDTTTGQDGTWVDIKVYSGVSWSNNSLQRFVLDDEVEYYAYRIYVKSVGRAFYDTDEFKLYSLLTHGLPELPSKWENISNVLPSSAQFLEQGMDNLSSLDRKVAELEPVIMTESNLEVGKVFGKTIDLKKNIDVRSIRVEVK